MNIGGPHIPGAGESELDRALRLCREDRTRDYGCAATSLLETWLDRAGPDLVLQAAAVHRRFRAAPHLRAQYEQEILAGRLTLAQVLAATN